MKILVTGGCGFIGINLLNKLLSNNDFSIFNIDKLGYASNSLFNKKLSNKTNYHFYQLDLIKDKELDIIFEKIKPDLVMHLAAESHVDRSISSPRIFIESNIIGTYNLLESSRRYYESLNIEKKLQFRFHHISTDEVFGSLDEDGKFSEETPYDPRSPYSASKASSDHLVRSWFHTYGLPIIITNCSNNFGPWQYPEKLIPLTILKANKSEKIPIYGDGSNIRDWLYVEDHVEALILAATKGEIGETYCIGGFGEKTNLEVVKNICQILDVLSPKEIEHHELITFIEDRKGHDKRYSINPHKIQSKLDWEPKYSFEEALLKTIKWYISSENFYSL